MMMNPTMNRIEQLDNFQDSIQSTQAIDRLRAMQGLIVTGKHHHFFIPLGFI